MKIAGIGGGPAGLYAALLLKKASPGLEVDVYERNRADDTFGWGVVFSDETLGNFEEADPESFARITERFISWTAIDTWFKGTCTTSTGHGFCGLSRKVLLGILQDRCRELGVRLHFQSEVTDLDAHLGADLVIAADGINSLVRERFKEHFEPTLDWRRCRFTWLGTTKPLEAFTFIFKESPHGLFQVHAYPFERGLSTFIVECREEVWRRAGLDRADEAATVAFCEELFAEHLDGHPLLTNRSIWRVFPTVRNARWHHRNVALLGDAVHTAHFSIGSGTKLAMEDAIALARAFEERAGEGVPAVLAAYQEARWVEVAKLQKAAQTSLEWFENSARYLAQEPLPFVFNLLTRSKRITWSNLARRDPALVARVAEDFRARAGAPRASDGSTPPPAFTPFRLRSLVLANRIVVSPMCQYSAEDGEVSDWHLVHLGSRAIGGAGLVMTEMTDVSREGRITPGCAGLYAPAHVLAWRRIVDFVHRWSRAKIGIQLAHAGRKGSTKLAWEGMDEPLASGGWPIISASAIPYLPQSPVPKEMDRGDMVRVRDDFVRATLLAGEAGFDLVELHMAHGYLLSSFISPLTNRRKDAYGGDVQSRMRYPLEVFDAVRAAWPEDRPISVRISATDWAEGGLSGDDAVVVARLLAEHGCDVVDVSTGQTVPWAKPDYGRMYQVPFAEQIRYEVGVPVMTVGAVQGVDHANTILAAGRADLCVMARPHLADPYLTLHAAAACGFPDQHWPDQYLSAR